MATTMYACITIKYYDKSHTLSSFHFVSTIVPPLTVVSMAIRGAVQRKEKTYFHRDMERGIELRCRQTDCKRVTGQVMLSRKRCPPSLLIHGSLQSVYNGLAPIKDDSEHFSYSLHYSPQSTSKAIRTYTESIGTTAPSQPWNFQPSSTH